VKNTLQWVHLSMRKVKNIGIQCTRVGTLHAAHLKNIPLSSQLTGMAVLLIILTDTTTVNHHIRATKTQ
jgi:hypothetical protein